MLFCSKPTPVTNWTRSKVVFLGVFRLLFYLNYCSFLLFVALLAETFDNICRNSNIYRGTLSLYKECFSRDKRSKNSSNLSSIRPCHFKIPTGNKYWRWFIEHACIHPWALCLVHTCKNREFPPSGLCEWILNKLKYGTAFAKVQNSLNHIGQKKPSPSLTTTDGPISRFCFLYYVLLLQHGGHFEYLNIQCV